MAKHEHHTCKHESLAYCQKCDVVYCKDCPMEWRPPCTQSHGPYWYVNFDDTWKSSVPTYTGSVTNCAQTSHAHDHTAAVA